MQRYFISEIFPDALYTAGVLRVDIENTLVKRGYRALQIPAGRSWTTRLLGFLTVRKISGIFYHNDLAFFHFPLRSRKQRYLLLQLKKKKVTCIAYVHDFEGIRDQDRTQLAAEIDQLKNFDGILAQNQVMKAWIEKMTGKAAVVDIEMYDYLEVPGIKSVPHNRGVIVFAGNLAKASFITKLESFTSIKFTVFGEPKPSAPPAANIIYKGNIDPRLLPEQLAQEAGFGLVWDGSSIQSGKDAGAYLRINTPHKLALYIMAGVPVIAWKESAMAAWIAQKQIGITVPSLTDLPAYLSHVSTEDYDRFRKNMEPLRARMSAGNFLETALDELEKKLA